MVRVLTHTISVQRVVLAENLGVLSPQDTVEKGYLEMGWTGKETCIKCDQGGKVLVCSERGCPLSVHEECMCCSARFDDLGNFYCPYCIFKHAILESCKAKKKAMLAKKALSDFLDKGMIDSEQQKQKAENVKGKEPKLSNVMGETGHFVQTGEDQQQGNCDPECTTSILPFKAVEISSVKERNNVGLLRNEDNAGLDDRDQNEIVVEQQIHPDSIIVSGSGGKHCREDERGHQFKMVQAEVQAEHQRQVDDNQHERVVEDELQAEPLCTSPVEEDLDVALHIPTKGKQKSAEILEKNEVRTVEEEEMQPGHQFEMVQAAERCQAEHQRRADDNQHERLVEDEQQAKPLCASPVEEDLDVALHIPTKGKQKSAEILEKNESRTVEEEDMQPGDQFKMVQAAERFQAEHQRRVDDNQHNRLVEDEQQAEPLGASSVEEDLDVPLHIPTEGKRKQAEILEKNEVRTVEEEVMQPGHQFKMVQAAERCQEEHQRRVDDNQRERLVEDEQQAEPLCASLVEEDLDVALHLPTKGKQKSAEILDKNEGRTVEEEEMQPGHQFKMVQAVERFQAEHQRQVDDNHQRQVDDNQHERVVEDEQQAEPLSASPVEDDLDVALHIPTKGKRKRAEILEKNEGRTVEEEMQERVQDTIVSSSGRNPASQVRVKAKKRSVVHHLQNVATPRRSQRKLSQNVATPRRSSRKLSFELDITSEQNEENTITKKPRQFQKPTTRQKKPTFPKVRRKNRPWTEEEEEMLKVGVQKYSTEVNQNLPWRKILEFGCDVFDGTRTPVDLKDKWRNMAKRCSTNQ